MTHKYRLPCVALLAVIIIDQIIKYLVETRMAYQQAIEVLPFIALYRTYNTGIAFSMLDGFGPLPLIIIALIVSAFVAHLWWQSDPGRHIAHYGFAIIIGGAIGNLIDRARFGHVVDYFLFHLPQWSFAVFNLADAAITVGVGLILLDELIAWRRQKQPQA